MKIKPLLPWRIALLAALLALSGCGERPWNDPYPVSEWGQNILYTAFTDRPKHLDPAQSYAEDEINFTAQIYEPPLQYHYLKRPYTLIPASAAAVPHPRYYDAQGHPLPEDADPARIAKSVYDIAIKPGIRYQPHPAFARDAQGRPRYLHLTPGQLAGVRQLSDFPYTGTRELTAADFVYGIKRLASPRLSSPILGMMAGHIVGLGDLATRLQKASPEAGPWLDLDRFDLSGVRALDRYTYRVELNGKYPQFLYWLSMAFFAPIPREVDQFYNQPGMGERNLSLDWYPVGTGPYMLTENNPNSRMVLSRNPNFHGETYPCEGEPGDRAAGLLRDCGKPMPFIDKAVFTREKESIPYWNKFLQGYYDASGISSDSFDQAVKVNVGGDVGLTPEMAAKGIRLLASVKTTTDYMGFNMLDPVVGGLGERGRKLRQAVSIAIDQEEFISIFLNGRGIVAMDPLPPGIFGHREGAAGLNPVVYDWDQGQPKRKSVAQARQLLAEAGWPHGRDAKTGAPLVLYLDTTSGGMGDKSRIDWLTRQLAKVDIQLVVRPTDWNRFQEKLRKGTVQLFYLGWNADYPDPENFFFLLASKEGKVLHGGENQVNYANPDFDRLFEQMRNMDNGAPREALIRRMNALLQQDAPWIFGFYPKVYTLGHAWLLNRKPTDVGNNILKYQRLDVGLRQKLRSQWNPPVRWPLWGGLLVLVALVLWTWGRRGRDTGGDSSGR